MGVAFGTDGIRGVANVDVTPEVALALGRAAARVLGGDRWLIGADTRASGPMLVAALSAGLAAAGADVVDLGVIPTPGVAFHAQRDGVPAAVVSASHNPFTDNGIKLLAAGGHKLADEVEHAIAALLDEPPASGGPVGGIRRNDDARGPYIDHLVGALEGRSLAGLHVVIDCAHGAASAIAPAVFRRLGARVTVLHAEPDGMNINAGCGSTYPQALQAAVVGAGAHLGLAFDGDADRVLAVDEAGALVDGDRIIGLCAADLHRRGLLRNGAVAVTVMSNLGLRVALDALGIEVVETAVGDRYVLAALDGRDLSLGGEQSGHVVFRDLATTGDGVLTGALLLDLVVREQRTLGDIAGAFMQQFPQVLHNVRVADPGGLGAAGEVWAEVARVEAELAGRGRVVLRSSGTEPLVRVMIEATTIEQAESMARRLGAVVARALI